MIAAIELNGVGKTYPRSLRRGPVVALNGITLRVERGEAFGFIGPNGAGKSTTIKILTGALQPSEGTALINGKDCRNHEARLGVGYVPENPYLSDYLTPFEVLSHGARLHGLTGELAARHCNEWLERFGLASVAQRMIRTFSKGMIQRTALAHALAVRPSVLILDEPLSGLDPIGRRDVVEILSEYRGTGGTLLFSSHVLHDVEHLADRYGLIHEGMLRTVSSPGELLGKDNQVSIRSQGGARVEGQVAQPGGGWIWELAQVDLWAALDALHGAGQELLEVRPRLSLESAFMRVIEQAKSSTMSTN